MCHSLFAFLFFILPFIYGIPYGDFDSDSTTGTQQLNSLPQSAPEALTDQPFYTSGFMNNLNFLDGWITADALYPGSLDTSSQITPTTDISNSFLPSTDASQRFILSAGLNNPTYTSNPLENQDGNGGASTDTMNIGGSPQPVEMAFKAWWWRPPPDVEPQDRPTADDPNCHRQQSSDNSHQRFLSCCNKDQTICVYFKRTHPLCSRVRTWRGPTLPWQCCSDVPVEEGGGVECRNANNNFSVHVPSFITPFGKTPDIKFKVDLPDTPKGVGEGEGAEGAPVEVGPGLRR